MNVNTISPFLPVQEAMFTVSAVRPVPGRDEGLGSGSLAQSVIVGPDYTVFLSQEAQSTAVALGGGEQKNAPAQQGASSARAVSNAEQTIVAPQQELAAAYGPYAAGRSSFDAPSAVDNVAAAYAGTMGALISAGDPVAAMAASAQRNVPLAEPGGLSAKETGAYPSAGDEERSLTRAFMGGSEGTSLSAGQLGESATDTGLASGEEGRRQGTGRQLSEAEQRQVENLKSSDQELRTNEQVQMALGMGLTTGGASYQTITGPDGRAYAVGGKVGIDVSEETTPAESESKARKIQAVAFTPMASSAEDRIVGAQAAQMEAEARTERVEQNGFLSGLAGIAGGGFTGFGGSQSQLAQQKAARAYGQTATLTLSSSQGSLVSLVA